MLNADALVARHGVCFVLRSPEVGDVGGVDLVLIEQVDGGVLIADAVVMGAAVGLEHVEMRDRHAVVCCAYYKGSAADLLLSQGQSCNCTLSDVICCEDAYGQGEND